MGPLSSWRVHLLNSKITIERSGALLGETPRFTGIIAPHVWRFNAFSFAHEGFHFDAHVSTDLNTITVNHGADLQLTLVRQNP